MLQSIASRRLLGSVAIVAGFCAAAPAARADLNIIPVFGSSVTGNANAKTIESVIDAAIGTIDSLYSNPLSIDVTFNYQNLGGGILLETSESLYYTSYAAYTGQLSADSTANPGNTVLASAVADLPYGNDANAAVSVDFSGALGAMLGLNPASASNATITIDSAYYPFSASGSTSKYDLNGGLEHELDEVLGGGGAGSILNLDQYYCGGSTCLLYYGALDLYRYSAARKPSFTTSSTASSYFSINGGTTKIVAFNQNSSGDYGDFGPPGATGPAGQYIQDAFSATRKDEPYTSSSPEYEMLEALGYDPTNAGAIALSFKSFSGLGALSHTVAI